MIDKLQELKKIGFYEIDDCYIQKNMSKGLIAKAKKQGKNFILARKYNDIVMFYSEEYLATKTIEELKNTQI